MTTISSIAIFLGKAFIGLFLSMLTISAILHLAAWLIGPFGFDESDDDVE